MSVLNRDDFLARIHALVGDNTDDATLSVIEDMTDTYDDMVSRANGDGVNWEEKYHQLDNDWRKRYTERFFDGGSQEPPPTTGNSDDDDKADIQIDDLFS